MTNEEVARKLAAITGKPLSEFFNGTISSSGVKTSTLSPIEQTEVDKNNTLPRDKSKRGENNNTTVPSEEVLEYQKMFIGSKLSKDNTCIMDGRQMTRKEYLKLIKGLDRNSIFKHPLMYKMFRSEGQIEAAFPAWIEKFPKAKDED
jgi:hypothetical protein